MLEQELRKMSNCKPIEFYQKFWPDLEGDWEFEQNIDRALDLDSQHQSLHEELEFQLRCCYTDYHFREFAEKYNNIEDNKKILKQFINDVNRLRKHPNFSEKIYYTNDLKPKIDLLKQYSDEYLITTQLEQLTGYLDDLKPQLHISDDPFEIGFEGFGFTEDQAFERIRKNSKWHNVERDITIFQEKQFYTLRQLAKRYGLNYKSIHSIVTKVQGAISEIIGTEFEKFILKKLRDSKLFERVERKAGTGEPDILAYKNDSELLIYSLKYLKLDASPYWLIKNELRPEIDYAKLCSQDYEIHLILLVFDTISQKIIYLEIDYENPENLELTKFLK